MPHTIDMILGLPSLRNGPILARAVALKVPVLVSANSFSMWSRRPDGARRWDRFNTASLRNADRLHALYLDSAGFVAANLYRSFPWGVDDYLDLAASYPFIRFFSMDCCVEPEIALNRDVVLDRIAATIRLNVLCRNGALERGIHHRFAPVIQGWTAADYAVCVDGMPFLDGYRTVGVGSMCRRPVHGENGVLHILSLLDAILPPMVRLHLFGLKSQAAEAVRGHPRVASVDSQAWGTMARWSALKAGVSKSDAYSADTMERWLARQTDRIAKPGFAFQESLALARPALRLPPWEAAIERAQLLVRRLVAEGELDYDQITDHYVLAIAGDMMADPNASDDDTDAAEAA